MRTPRPRHAHGHQPRPIGTLIGNGWLREAPNAPRRDWDVRGRSALRKCMFLPVPEYIRQMPMFQKALAEDAAAKPLPPPRGARDTAPSVYQPEAPRPHDPRRDVRMMPVVPPSHRAGSELPPSHQPQFQPAFDRPSHLPPPSHVPPHARGPHGPPAHGHAQAQRPITTPPRGRRPLSNSHRVATRPAWYEDPLALGSLLIVCAPIGLSVLWSSKRYSNDARWALTVMTGLMMFITAAIVITLLAVK